MEEMISEEEFSSMTFEEQKTYMIDIIKKMSGKEQKEFYEKIIESGILKD